MNGLLLVNKPSGCTSHDVVALCRKALHQKEIGHTGTLDPMAEGLMLLTLGEATKLSLYLQEAAKAYNFSFLLGVESDTLDSTGITISKSESLPNKSAVLSQAQGQVGEFLWPIPMYSAKKLDGKKLYEYARAGESVEIPRKLMKFWDLQLEAKDDRNYCGYFACSKGSFVRTWTQQLGQSLGCGAVLTSLQRVSTNSYDLKNALSLDKIQELGETVEQTPSFVPIQNALPNLKSLEIGGQDQRLLQNGQISHDLRKMLVQRFDPAKDEYIQIHSQSGQVLVAIIGLEKGEGFKIRRVFRH